MAKNKAISFVANTIKKLHIHKNIHFIYKQDYYEDKLKEIDDLFIEYRVPTMDDIDRPLLLEEWGENVDTSS